MNFYEWLPSPSPTLKICAGLEASDSRPWYDLWTHTSRAKQARLVYSHLPDCITYPVVYPIMTRGGARRTNTLSNGEEWKPWSTNKIFLWIAVKFTKKRFLVVAMDEMQWTIGFWYTYQVKHVINEASNFLGWYLLWKCFKEIPNYYKFGVYYIILLPFVFEIDGSCHD